MLPEHPFQLTHGIPNDLPSPNRLPPYDLVDSRCMYLIQTESLSLDWQRQQKLSLRTLPGRKQDVQHTVSLCSIEKWHTVLILTILPQEEARNTECAFIAKV